MNIARDDEAHGVGIPLAIALSIGVGLGMAGLSGGGV